MIESLWIMICIALSCSLTGSLLVMKQSAMITDAVSHTALLGIVLSFFIVQDLDSPVLLVGAAIFAVLTVLAVELLAKQFTMNQDMAIGVIVPTFFALAVLLVSKYFKNVHLDTDMVLLGDIVFAPLNRMTVFEFSISKGLWQGLWLLIINVLFISTTFPKLKIRLFDESFARSLGIHIALLDAALMVLVSLTSVISFQSVGAILVISLMIAPALSAQCFAKSLEELLLLSIVISITNCVIGYYGSLYWNVSMSGAVSVVGFLSFIACFVLSRSHKTSL